MDSDTGPFSSTPAQISKMERMIMWIMIVFVFLVAIVGLSLAIYDTVDRTIITPQLKQYADTKMQVFGPFKDLQTWTLRVYQQGNFTTLMVLGGYAAMTKGSPIKSLLPIPAAYHANIPQTGDTNILAFPVRTYDLVFGNNVGTFTLNYDGTFWIFATIVGDFFNSTQSASGYGGMVNCTITYTTA